MTPSIIRRFAKYHGIDDLPHIADDGAGITDARVWLISPTRSLVRVVQLLTRIEDAEAILDSAPTQTDPAYTRGYRRAVLDIGESMVHRAGVEFERWAQVKE